MEFHPQKCSILSVTRSRSPIRYPYQLKGHTLELQDTTKYLGVDLQSTLSWQKHIDRVTKKANSMLGILRRNLKSTSVETKTNAYFSMVRPNLEYCSSVWNPHQKDLIYKVEMIQRRAARYVSNRYRNTSSVSSMLDALQWESLESRRTKIQLTLLFKIINEMVDIRADDYLIPQQDLPDDQTPKSFDRSLLVQTPINSAFSPVPFLFGIPFQHQSLRPLLWYLSRRGYPPYPSKQC